MYAPRNIRQQVRVLCIPGFMLVLSCVILCRYISYTQPMTSLYLLFGVFVSNPPNMFDLRIIAVFTPLIVFLYHDQNAVVSYCCANVNALYRQYRLANVSVKAAWYIVCDAVYFCGLECLTCVLVDACCIGFNVQSLFMVFAAFVVRLCFVVFLLFLENALFIATKTLFGFVGVSLLLVWSLLNLQPMTMHMPQYMLWFIAPYHIYIFNNGINISQLPITACYFFFVVFLSWVAIYRLLFTYDAQ